MDKTNLIKVETHLHTKPVSICAHVEPEQIIDEHIKAGYDAIIVTDHFSTPLIKDVFKGDSYREKIEYFLSGYYKAKNYAEKINSNIQVWLGVEVNLTDRHSDQLVYGIDENFLFDNPEMCELSQGEFYKLVKSYNALLYQAHPFRPYCTRYEPEFLDGVEVYNGNPRHQNSNELAQKFAEDNNLRFLSGTDYHQLCDIGGGGVYVPKSVNNIFKFTEFIRDNNPILIK